MRGKTCVSAKGGSSASSSSSSSEEKTLNVETTTTAMVPYVPPLLHESVLLLNGGVEGELMNAQQQQQSQSQQPQSGQPYILGDIVPIILSYCGAATLSRAASVCAEWKRIAHGDELWENLCRERFGVSATEIRPRPDPTKLLYILAHRRLREVCRMNAMNPFTGQTYTRSVGSSMRTTAIPITLSGGP